MTRKTIGPITVLAIEALDKDISALHTQIQGLSTAGNNADASGAMTRINDLTTLLIGKFAEKTRLQLVQNRLIANISNCLGKNGGKLGGVIYDNCCPVHQVCTCANGKKIDVLVTFDSATTTVTNSDGSTIHVEPFSHLCPSADFCQIDDVGNNPIKAFEFASLFNNPNPSLINPVPAGITLWGIHYSL